MPRVKSSNGGGGKGGAHLPVLVDPRFVKALDHVLRQHILLAAVQGEVSPNGLSKALDEGLSQVSYHVKVLRDDCDGMIEETRTERRRGAVEHYYRGSAKTLLPAKAGRRLKKGLRAVVGAGQASDLFNDLAYALKAGKLKGTHDHITRTPLVLDGEGQRNVKAIAERATKEVENEQQATAKRMKKANGNGGQATRSLREFGLFKNRDDEIVEPTPGSAPRCRTPYIAAHTHLSPDLPALSADSHSPANGARPRYCWQDDTWLFVFRHRDPQLVEFGQRLTSRAPVADLAATAPRNANQRAVAGPEVDPVVAQAHRARHRREVERAAAVGAKFVGPNIGFEARRS